MINDSFISELNNMLNQCGYWGRRYNNTPNVVCSVMGLNRLDFESIEHTIAIVDALVAIARSAIDRGSCTGSSICK